MSIEKLRKYLEDFYTYITDKKVVQWSDKIWNYIDLGSTPPYDGSFIVRRNDNEIISDLPNLEKLVKNKEVLAVKYTNENIHAANGFSELPPVIFYCKTKDCEKVKQVLEANGYSDAEWRLDNRTIFNMWR